MNKWIMFMLVLLVSISAQAEIHGNIGSVPMPPKLSMQDSVDHILMNYPLGVITKIAAYSHHGQPHKTVKLPNGLSGWVYENAFRTQQKVTMPSGEKRETTSLDNAYIASTYTLVFDSDGVVTDVLYQETSHENSRSALLIQRNEIPDVEIELWRPGSQDRQ